MWFNWGQQLLLIQNIWIMESREPIVGYIIISRSGHFTYFQSYMSQPKSQLQTFKAWAGKWGFMLLISVPISCDHVPISCDHVPGPLTSAIIWTLITSTSTVGQFRVNIENNKLMNNWWISLNDYYNIINKWDINDIGWFKSIWYTLLSSLISALWLMPLWLLLSCHPSPLIINLSLLLFISRSIDYGFKIFIIIIIVFSSLHTRPSHRPLPTYSSDCIQCFWCRRKRRLCWGDRRLHHVGRRLGEYHPRYNRRGDSSRAKWKG